jgi:hypothetical protein
MAPTRAAHRSLAGGSMPCVPSAVSPDLEALLRAACVAFNARDIDAVLALMHADVGWPNGMEGHGNAGMREYRTRQWNMINPIVTPIGLLADRG